VTATIDGNAAELDDLQATGTTSTQALTITVDDAVTTAQGAAIADATSVATVDFSAAGVSDNLAGLTTGGGAVSASMAKIDAKDADVNVTVTDAALALADIADLNALTVATNGVITATLTDTLANLATLATASTDAITVTVTSLSNAAADLLTLDGKTSVEVVATAMTDISGTFDDVKAVVITADDANTINTDGDYDATISDTTIAATSLSEIDGDTSGTVTATAATTITGTAADVITAIQSTGITTATDYNVTLSGAATVGQLTTIDGDTTGAISAAAITDTFSAINTLALNSATTLQNATGPITANGNFADNSMDMTDVGNLADLVINGGGGNDTIIGAQGNDTITGGTGNDILFGGLGTDTFVIADIENNGSDQFFTFTTNGDNANVNQGTDVLQFSDADLTGVASFVAYTGGGAGLALTLNDGATDVELVSGANAQASGAEAAFLFDTSTGVLSFDADGSGAGAVINVGTFYSDSGSTLITDILAADFNFIA